MAYYVMTGPHAHWTYGLKNKVWGVRKESPTLQGIWSRINAGDDAILYCSRISVVLGTARIVGRREKREPWWFEELQSGENIYQYIIDLDDLTLLVEPDAQEDEWKKHGLSNVRELGITRGHITRGANPIKTDGEQIFQRTYEAVRKQRHAGKRIASESPQHDRIRERIYEIGLLLDRPAAKEYKINNKRLDVVWKRIPQGVPSFVFEVHVAGNLYAAFAKLKHAWDLWNSKPVLVTTDQHMEEARNWLSGSFHEMQHVAVILDWADVARFHQSLERVSEIRSKLGL